MTSEKIHCKIYFQNEIIRVSLQEDISIFEFKQSLSYHHQILIQKVYYLDNENEWITVENKNDWEYGIKHFLNSSEQYIFKIKGNRYFIKFSGFTKSFIFESNQFI
jgi:hypothetical protein